ncbi:helix-turn-helix domain-containing protein [Mariniflexile sp. HNIBRBA6329]|uniref:hybrid sensor histidine kinase/response regulator transcription factor n=1 Tax=Mariniflexile sp. HNIBRBA6329 TaxID=3373088 RepID=UPI0037469546
MIKGFYQNKNKQYKLYVIIVWMFFLLFNNQTTSQNLFFEKVYGQGVNPITPIHGITKDPIGYIWFGSWNGLYRYDGKTFDLFYHNPNDTKSIPNNRIRNVVSDDKYGLWLLTFDWKYVKFNYEQNNFQIKEDGEVPELIKTQLANNSNKINADKVVDGKVYYLSSHQFISIDLKTKKEFCYLADINQPGRLFDDYVSSFFIDNESIIWLGTRNGDIYKANPNRNPFNLHYTYKPKTNRSKLTTVRDIVKVENTVWVGTDEGVLIYDDNDELDINHPFYKSNSKIKFVRTLFKDKNGGVWIGGVNGLEYYNPRTKVFIPVIVDEFHAGIEIKSVYAIEAFDENIIWVGLYNGIAKVDIQTHEMVFYELIDEIQDHSVTDILFLDKYHLLIATEGNGIVPLKLNDALEATVDDSLYTSSLKTKVSRKIIYALHKDKKGDIWVGSSEGLNKIDIKSNPVRVENVRLQYDTPGTYISSITDDEDGNIWIAHKEGISLIRAISGEVLNYQKLDQFGSWSFWERAFYKDTLHSTIYFGAKNGYVSFNPQKIRNVFRGESRLILKSLYISNQKVIPMDTIKDKPILSKTLSQTKSIDLDYDNRNFGIEFSSLNFHNASKEVFEYKLEGYDEDWIKTTNNKVSYNKVPPGDYIFKVRSTMHPKGKVVKLKVHISALWYNTTLAKFIFIVLLLLILYFVFREVLYRDRLKNEIKLERLNREQQAELNKEKLEFFTSVSHELKTPLTLISDPLKQLRKGQLNHQDREIYLSIVDRNVANLNRLIHQILEFRKSEKGKLKVNTTLCDFSELIQSCYNSFELIAANRNIKFYLDADKAPSSCYLDIDKTEQIIINILSNAFKYTPDGGSVLFSVNLNSDNSFIKIKIKDTGIGIQSSSLKKIFKPFNNIGARPFHGNSSGIGLSLTKNLVHLLNGTIKLDSYPQKGTKVSIKIPYIKGEQLKEDVQNVKSFHEVNEENVQIDIDNEKPTILIVEDNADVQAYLNKELSSQFTLLQEYNGKKGLEKAIEHIPDLIVSDIMMPIMEGVDMCKHLKLNESTCHIPVILLTAKDSDENQIEGYEYGAEAYITKPFSVDVLKAQIKSVLENRLLLQKQKALLTSVDKLQKELPDLDHLFIEKVTGFITQEISNTDFNSDRLAELLEISQSQLYRKLKAVSGSTVHEFITRVKMDHAENLLIYSNLNVSQIAYETGFSEPSNFSRTFSKHFGCSPSNYLKKKKS